MIARILSLSVRARYVVVFLTLLVAAFGVFNLIRLPIDAVPDITNKQVQINTSDPELGPLEIEKRVTFPIETALAGIPGLESTRSLSRNGFSQVTAVFTEGTDIYFARQQVTERLAQSRDALPEDVQPTIGPITTGLGDIFMWTVEFAKRDAAAVAANAGKPGWQPDGTFLTVEGESLADEGLARRLPPDGAGLDHPAPDARDRERRGDRFHRWLREAVCHRTRPGQACGLWRVLRGARPGA